MDNQQQPQQEPKSEGIFTRIKNHPFLVHAFYLVIIFMFIISTRIQNVGQFVGISTFLIVILSVLYWINQWITEEDEIDEWDAINFASERISEKDVYGVMGQLDLAPENFACKQYGMSFVLWYKPWMTYWAMHGRKKRGIFGYKKKIIMTTQGGADSIDQAIEDINKYPAVDRAVQTAGKLLPSDYKKEIEETREEE